MAFEPVRVAWPDRRIVAQTRELLVVDKPVRLAVHGGDSLLRDDVVTRVAARLAERDEDPWLGVHQRLDLGTSGVLCFGRDRAQSARLAALFEERRVEKTYVAGVHDPGLPDQGRLSHRLLHEKGRTRVVARGGQAAVTRYRVLRRDRGRALVELWPETGRTHQLRVQLAQLGAPIAGDALYGGAAAHRLMLHAQALELPGFGRFEALAPRDLGDWVAGADAALGDARDAAERLFDAAWLRRPLFARTDALRLVNDVADGLPGVVVDRYGDFALLSLSDERAVERADELARACLALGARGVYVKRRPRADLRRVDVAEHASATPHAGEAAPDPLVVREGTATFAVRLGDGLSTGLFVDQRDNRARVTEWSSGARVLNLFAYTCSFSVAAALGGARQVTSVDLSARALARGRENFRLNALDVAAHRFVKDDAVDWLKRAARRAERFDLVLLDPPSFATVGKKTLSAARDHERLAALVLAVVAPGGRLLAVTNHRGTSVTALRRALHSAARTANVRLARLVDLAAGIDCPAFPDGPSPSKAVLATLG